MRARDASFFLCRRLTQLAERFSLATSPWAATLAHTAEHARSSRGAGAARCTRAAQAGADGERADVWVLAPWCAVYLEISRQAGNDALAPATFAPAWAAAGTGTGRGEAENAGTLTTRRLRCSWTAVQRLLWLAGTSRTWGRGQVVGGPMSQALTRIGERSYKLTGCQSRMSRRASSGASLTGPPSDAPLPVLAPRWCWPEHRRSRVYQSKTAQSRAGTDRRPGSKGRSAECEHRATFR